MGGGEDSRDGSEVKNTCFPKGSALTSGNLQPPITPEALIASLASTDTHTHENTHTHNGEQKLNPKFNYCTANNNHII